MPRSKALRSTLNAAAVCEAIWCSGGSGGVDAAAVTPLLLDGMPAVAFTYAEAERARAIAASRRVAIVLSDSRAAASGWQPLVAYGSPRLIADDTGELMREKLLTQELRKHPPSRPLADSLLLRREHWWYLPRLVVVVDVDEVCPVGMRNPDDAVLAVAAPRLRAETVRLVDAPADPGPESTVMLDPIGETPPPHEGSAVLLRHDFSVPDFEVRTQWKAYGTVDGNAFTVVDAGGTLDLPRPPGLLNRMRRQRDLARACRRALEVLTIPHCKAQHG